MKLCLIFGDQLSPSLSSLADLDQQNDILLMCEVHSEATYVKHHKKKIAFVFSAMRHFAEELSGEGYNIRYIKYDNPDNTGSLIGEVARIIAQNAITEVVVTAPGEHRLQMEMAGWSAELNLPVILKEDDRFLCTPAEFATWAEGRKQLRMEYFYREMRRKYSVLMDQGSPIGGQWNYDAENRKPSSSGLDVPDTFRAQPDDIT